MTDIKNSKVAILATHGFEQSELTSPLQALKDAGADVDIISPDGPSIKGWQGKDWGDSVNVDVPLTEAKAEEYDALVLPGGVINPDKLRTNEDVLKFVRHFVESGKIVAAICHGPWTLINADAVEGRTMTSYPTLRKDLENAGAKWVDEQVVVDNGFVTSRNPDDLDAFNSKVIEEISEGKHRRAA